MSDNNKGPLLVDEEATYTKHYVRWWEKWFNPTTAMALFGAIVWGIQLNFAVLQNTKDIGEAEALNQKLISVVQEISEQQVRLSVNQENITRRIERIEINVKD